MHRRGDLPHVGESAEAVAVAVIEKLAVPVGLGGGAHHLGHVVDVKLEGLGLVVRVREDAVARGHRVIVHILVRKGREGHLFVRGQLRHEHVAVGPVLRGFRGELGDGQGKHAGTLVPAPVDAGRPLPRVAGGEHPVNLSRVLVHKVQRHVLDVLLISGAVEVIVLPLGHIDGEGELLAVHGQGVDGAVEDADLVGVGADEMRALLGEGVHLHRAHVGGDGLHGLPRVADLRALGGGGGGDVREQDAGGAVIGDGVGHRQAGQGEDGGQLEVAVFVGPGPRVAVSHVGVGGHHRVGGAALRRQVEGRGGHGAADGGVGGGEGEVVHERPVPVVGHEPAAGPHLELHPVGGAALRREEVHRGAAGLHPVALGPQGDCAALGHGCQGNTHVGVDVLIDGVDVTVPRLRAGDARDREEALGGIQIIQGRLADLHRHAVALLGEGGLEGVVGHIHHNVNVLPGAGEGHAVLAIAAQVMGVRPILDHTGLAALADLVGDAVPLQVVLAAGGADHGTEVGSVAQMVGVGTFRMDLGLAPEGFGAELVGEKGHIVDVDLVAALAALQRVQAQPLDIVLPVFVGDLHHILMPLSVGF